jgi:hypothetical protein
MSYQKLDELYTRAQNLAEAAMLVGDKHSFWRYYAIANRILIWKLNKI